MFLSSFYKWRNRSKERSDDWPMISQPVNDGPRIVNRRKRRFIILGGWSPLSLQMRVRLERRSNEVSPPTTQERTIYLPKMMFLWAGDFQVSGPSPLYGHRCAHLCQRRGASKNLSLGIQSRRTRNKMRQRAQGSRPDLTVLQKGYGHCCAMHARHQQPASVRTPPSQHPCLLLHARAQTVSLFGSGFSSSMSHYLP